MNVKPLNDRVIVKRADAVTKTASGLYIPDMAAEKPQQGEVLAVGEGYPDGNGGFRALAVKAGDKVLFTKNAGQNVKVDGQDVVVMKEEDIIAVVED